MAENKVVVEYEMDGSNYYLDLNAACAFITNADGNNGKHGDERVEKEILNSYDVDEEGGMILDSKTVREVSGLNDGTRDNIRYDLLKTLLIQVLTFEDKTALQDDVSLPIVHVEFLPLGTRIAFNSLVQAGIIKIKEAKIK